MISPRLLSHSSWDVSVPDSSLQASPFGRDAVSKHIKLLNCGIKCLEVHMVIKTNTNTGKMTKWARDCLI